MVLVGKSEGRRSLGRPKYKWNYNIKMHVKEVGWGSMDWIDVAEVRDRWRAHVSAVINLWVP